MNSSAVINPGGVVLGSEIISADELLVDARVHALVDRLLEEPGRKVHELSELTGCTPMECRKLMVTAVFQEEFNRRRSVIQLAYGTWVLEKLQRAAGIGLEEMGLRIKAGGVGGQELNSFTRTAMEGMGMLNKNGAGSSVSNSVTQVNNIVTVRDLQEAREIYARVNAIKPVLEALPDD